MRVTSTMKDYIRDCVKKKVADKLAAAETAKNIQAEKDSKTLEAVKDYAKSLIPDAMEKVTAFAKKQGLTWLDHRPSLWSGTNPRDINVAFSVDVDAYDFEETNPQDSNKSDARKMRKEIEDEPKRIKRAVDRAVNSIVFSLELGKVKKAELEELIASTEVEL